VRSLFITIALLLATPTQVVAEVEPAAIRLPEATAWTGQRIPVLVELRAQGSFGGAASFSIPQIRGSILIKIGSPVVSSREIEGDSWFVQTHEFALFSQQTGTVEIPSFEVRYGARDGFTGPVEDRVATVPEARVHIRRPPGSEQLGFLVTTESIDISESWEPQPGPAKVGDVFKRTITQQADEMTGIALAPPPHTAPEGVRVYVADPKVEDNTERGAFVGKREDTITYVLQQPGTTTLPAIRYVWWNPTKKELRSKTLPAVTFHVAAPAVTADDVPTAGVLDWGGWLAAAILLLGLTFWQRDRIACKLHNVWQMLNPPGRVAARSLRRACHDGDPVAASQAWLTWQRLQPSDLELSPSLITAATDLQRHLYGPQPAETWDGGPLARAFREQLATESGRRRKPTHSDLPSLNPLS